MEIDIRYGVYVRRVRGADSENGADSASHFLRDTRFRMMQV